MKRFRIFGMDWFDVVVHAGVTCMAGISADSMFGGRSGEVAVSAVFAVSLILLGVRRKHALARLGDSTTDPARLEELEARLAELDSIDGRLADLESGQHRMAELEERLDFAERLLTRSREEQIAPGRER